MLVEIDGVLYVPANGKRIVLDGATYVLVPTASVPVVQEEEPVGLPDTVVDDDIDKWVRQGSQDLYECSSSPGLSPHTYVAIREEFGIREEYRNF